MGEILNENRKSMGIGIFREPGVWVMRDASTGRKLLWLATGIEYIL